MIYLPDKVVDAPSIQRKLDKHWRVQDLIFNYEAAHKLGNKDNYELIAPNICSNRMKIWTHRTNNSRPVYTRALHGLG